MDLPPLQTIAKLLGGEVRNGQVSAPGPNHSPIDRSMTVRPDHNAPDGFVVFSHANDDALTCKDYVREKLNLPAFKPNGNARRRRASSSDTIAAHMHAALRAQTTHNEKPKGKIVATYDYKSADNVLLYQNIRYTDPKDFRQRRPDGKGGWIWKLGDTPHVPYRLPEMLAFPDATIFLCEGEKDANNVAALDLIATSVATWTADCVAAFAARDVIILEDNDEAGRKKAITAAKALHGTAKTIRIVSLPNLKEGGDVSDWLDADRSYAQKFESVCFDFPLWTPADIPEGLDTATTEEEKPARFKFKRFAEVMLTTGLNYLVKGIVPREGIVVIWGPPKCGKSFLTLDLAIHIALGRKYREHKVQQGAVAYLALEGGSGFHARIEAWRQNNLGKDRGDVPFYLLTVPVDLVADHTKLIEAIRDQVNTPALVVIDTLNRSLAGSENDPKDMALYIRAADTVRDAFHSAVLIVHHCGIDGTRPRGHTSLTGAVDAQLAVRRESDGTITLIVEWMKDGPEGEMLYSRLDSVRVGTDDDGDVIFSCIVVEAEQSNEKLSKLSGDLRIAYQALCEAILDVGQPPPATIKAKIPDKKVCPIEVWKEAYFVRRISESDKPDTKQKAFRRAAQRLQELGFIGIYDDYVWLSGQPGQVRTN